MACATRWISTTIETQLNHQLAEWTARTYRYVIKFYAIAASKSLEFIQVISMWPNAAEMKAGRHWLSIFFLCARRRANCWYIVSPTALPVGVEFDVINQFGGVLVGRDWLQLNLSLISIGFCKLHAVNLATPLYWLSRHFESICCYFNRFSKSEKIQRNGQLFQQFAYQFS